MASSQTLLFVIVGRNEPIFEAEFVQTRGGTAQQSDAVTRQNYFVLHSALDLVEKAAWTTSGMYLRVVDKVRNLFFCEPATNLCKDRHSCTGSGTVQWITFWAPQLINLVAC